MSKWITPLTCAVLGATAALPFIARLDGPPPPMRAGREPDMLVGRWQTNVAPDEAARQAGEREFEDVLIFTRGQTFESEENSASNRANTSTTPAASASPGGRPSRRANPAATHTGRAPFRAMKSRAR
jgi:hypothetical protein